MTVPRITAALAAALLVISAIVVACSTGDDPAGSVDPVSSEQTQAPDGGSLPATPTPSAYLDVPADVDLTDQGEALSFGDSATVAWEPRKQLVGALEVAVQAVERVPLSVFRGFRLTPETRASAAYFVRAGVENVGDTELAGVDVPLYAVDETNTLIRPSGFASRFRPCPSTPLPQDFRPGRRVEVCLVYLVPDDGDLTAVSFRPTQEFDPITWTGEQTTYRPGRDRRGERQGQGSQGRAARGQEPGQP